MSDHRHETDCVPVHSGDAVSGRVEWRGWHRPLPRPLASLCVLLVVLAPLALHTSGTNGYALSWDDFPLVQHAMSWERTEDALWQPYNNHFFPLFRILTWALVSGAGKLSAIPASLWLGWVTALTVSLLVLYEFVQRETSSAVAGLAAVLVAGMSSSYHMGGGLFATTQILWAVAFTLMALLGLQSIRDRFSWPAFLFAIAAVLLAPAWRAEGVLAGPVACLYVLASRRGDKTRAVRWVVGATPLAASIVMAVLERIVGGAALVESPARVWDAAVTDFRPVLGTYLTARIGTEHLGFWNFGFRNVLSLEQFVVCFSGLVFFAVWWCRRVRFVALAACAAAWMLASYWMVYTIRGNLGLDSLRASSWYLIVPQFGWAIFLSAGLVRDAARQVRPLSYLDGLKVAALGLALFLLHRPVVTGLDRSALANRQLNELRRLEAMAELGSELGVDESTMRDAMGPMVMSGSLEFDGLSLLEIPSRGRAWPLDEVRRRFEGIAVAGSPAEPATP